MTHFAVLCPEVPGHANSMSALALELTRRGHEISWLGSLDGRPQVERWGFRSLVFGEKEFPLGYLPKTMTELGRLTGFDAMRFTLRQYRLAMEVGLREMPPYLCEADALIADESIFSARTLAEHANLPWISICSALPMHPDPHLPPSPAGWSFGNSIVHRLRNRLGHLLGGILLRSVLRPVKQFRKQHRLPSYNMLHGNASRLATIAQISKEFDFPRSEAPDWFHYVGSLQKSQSRTAVDFPFEQLDDEPHARPLVYASMGTLQNGLFPIFQKIAAACAKTSCQLVLSLGGGGQPSDLGTLPGDPIVVRFAPQLELIQRASLVVTHAGMNSVTESLAGGVPMLALPVTNDQPGVASRVVHARCGESIPSRKATVERIRAGIQRILSDDRYAANAKRLAECNTLAGGLERAADIVESSVRGPSK